MALNILTLEEWVVMDAAADGSDPKQKDAAADAAESARVLVVDRSLSESADLAAAAKDDVRVVTYDSKADSLDTLSGLIAAALGGDKAQSIAFANHGVDGRFVLAAGETAGADTSGAAQEAFWRGLGALLQDGGRIDILACSIAGGDGASLLDRLADWTGRDIAASDDPTGNEDAGGDWTLERGGVDAAGWFDPQRLARFDGLLAPPGNDNFASATTFVGNSMTGIDNVDATKQVDEDWHAGYEGGHSVWWKWTAPGNGVVSWNTFGSNFDTLLAVYTGNMVDALTEIASNDQYNGDQSLVSFNAVAGTSYKIAVDGWNMQTGNITLSWDWGPANNDFARAGTLWGTSASVGGSNRDADKEAEGNHAGNAGGASVWYVWTPWTSGPVTISTAGSDFNTLLGVYTGTAVHALTAVASNDNRVAGDVTSEVSFYATANVTYRIAIDGFNGDEGNYTLSLQQMANDQFSNPTWTGGHWYSGSGTTVGATFEAGEPQHGYGAAHSVWFAWNAWDHGVLTVDTFGSSFDTLLAVYEGGPVSNLFLKAQNDDAEGVLQSKIMMEVFPGITYYIAVDGYNGAMGNYQFNLDFNPGSLGGGGNGPMGPGPGPMGPGPIGFGPMGPGPMGPGPMGFGPMGMGPGPDGGAGLGGEGDAAGGEAASSGRGDSIGANRESPGRNAFAGSEGQVDDAMLVGTLDAFAAMRAEDGGDFSGSSQEALDAALKSAALGRRVDLALADARALLGRLDGRIARLLGEAIDAAARDLDTVRDANGQLTGVLQVASRAGERSDRVLQDAVGGSAQTLAGANDRLFVTYKVLVALMRRIQELPAGEAGADALVAELQTLAATSREQAVQKIADLLSRRDRSQATATAALMWQLTQSGGKEGDAALRAALREALRKITGEQLGDDEAPPAGKPQTSAPEAGLDLAVAMLSAGPEAPAGYVRHDEALRLAVAGLR